MTRVWCMCGVGVGGVDDNGVFVCVWGGEGVSATGCVWGGGGGGGGM